MSALGHKRTLVHVRLMSALPPKADIGTRSRNVRFVPKADIGCARAASGQAEADPAITLMNSRRCITAPKAQEHADNWLITSGIGDRRNRVHRSVCTASILTRSCPLL